MFDDDFARFMAIWIWVVISFCIIFSVVRG